MLFGMPNNIETVKKEDIVVFQIFHYCFLLPFDSLKPFFQRLKIKPMFNYQNTNSNINYS